MRDYDSIRENQFFALFQEYYDLEKNANAQHDPNNYTLDRMFPLAEAAGHPEQRLKFIHVAGTKGKGSTCHFISALLQASGHSVGLFTSPHLSTVRERFQLNNQLISYDLLQQAGREFVHELQQRRLTPSLFELFTLLAMKIFADQGMEYAVIETGIGGTLDATNFIPTAEACVITPVSFDHMALLGNTIEDIATQKAGIIKRNVPVMIAKQPYAAGDSTIREQARRCQAPILTPASADDTAAYLPEPCPPFLKENMTVALGTVRQLGFTPQLAHFQLPQLRARCEVISQQPLVILDAAHNEDSMKHLVQALKTLYPDTHFTVVLGSVKGKDIRGMVSQLATLSAEFILTHPRTPRASALEELQQEARKAGLKVLQVIPDLHSPDQLPPNAPLLFTGSFFTAVIGEAFFSA